MKVRRTYVFAFYTSLFIAFWSSLIVYILNYVITDVILSFSELLYMGFIIFVLSFFIVQYRLEKFIYQRIQKIYDSVSILDASDFHKTNITSDIDSLSREVQKFAELKQQQIKILTERENYRREFLGNISHELKTPLFTVQGYLLTLLGGAMKDKKLRGKYLKSANKGVDRLIAIVKDLDMISKLESANFNLDKEPFNILELIQNIFELLEMKARKRNIKLYMKRHYEFPIMVLADRDRIEQVIINLVVNSIKYGKINGTTIVGVENHDDGKVLVSIIDDGEGIGEDQQVRVFERFYRIDQSRSRDQGGSGLGLSIVKHIVEAHGEEVFLESALGEGSTFSFTLEKFEQV
jgi:two-component system phosphate regulon sensor histidine kinase PhoR